MDSFEDWWARMVIRNPKLAEMDQVKITTRSVREIARAAWNRCETGALALFGQAILNSLARNQNN